MGLCPCHSRERTHPVGMVWCWEDECGGGTRSLPGCALLYSGCDFPMPPTWAPWCFLIRANLQPPPLSGERQKLMWRGNYSA